MTEKAFDEGYNEALKLENVKKAKLAELKWVTRVIRGHRFSAPTQAMYGIDYVLEVLKNKALELK